MAKNINCKSCGGLVIIEDDEDGGVCQYCGTYQYDENSVGSEELKKLLSAAEGFMKIRKYTEAEGKFLAVTKDYPQDYRGWWGLIRARSRDLTDYDISKSKLDEFDELYQYVLKMAKTANIANITASYEQYSSVVRENLRKLKDDAQRRWDSRNNDYLREADAVKAEIAKLENQMASYKKPSKVVLIALSIAWGALVIFLSIFEHISNLPAGILGFVILILPIWWICTKTVDNFYYKKVNETKRKIGVLKSRLLEIKAQNDRDQKPIEELLTKAGDA